MIGRRRRERRKQLPLLEFDGVMLCSMNDLKKGEIQNYCLTLVSGLFGVRSCSDGYG